MVTRRQSRQGLFQGLLFVVLGLLVVVSTVVDSHQRTAVRKQFEVCVSSQFTALTAAVNARKVLVDEDSASKTLVILTVAKAAVTKNPRATTAAALARFVKDQEALQQRLAKTKIPPYPNGKCR